MAAVPGAQCLHWPGACGPDIPSYILNFPHGGVGEGGEGGVCLLWHVPEQRCLLSSVDLSLFFVGDCEPERLDGNKSCYLVVTRVVISSDHWKHNRQSPSPSSHPNQLRYTLPSRLVPPHHLVKSCPLFPPTASTSSSPLHSIALARAPLPTPSPPHPPTPLHCTLAGRAPSAPAALISNSHCYFVHLGLGQTETPS